MRVWYMFEVGTRQRQDDGVFNINKQQMGRWTGAERAHRAAAQKPGAAGRRVSHLERFRRGEGVVMWAGACGAAFQGGLAVRTTREGEGDGCMA